VFVGGADLGIGVNVDSSTQLGLNFAYFFADNWNVELLAATPFDHDINLNTVGPLADTKQLPPSLTANYFFSNGPFKPYLGAGINYTLFFDEGFTQDNRAAGFSDLDLDDSFGLTFQAGFDYQFNDNWLFNASARWIDIDTDATFDLNGASGSVDVDIDPLVYTLSIGYIF
jgi:outer membrane protein